MVPKNRKICVTISSVLDDRLKVLSERLGVPKSTLISQMLGTYTFPEILELEICRELKKGLNKK